MEDMGKENPSAALVVPEEEVAASIIGDCGVVSVLFETPSGFAIFGYEAFRLTQPEAWKHIWADFVNVLKAAVWLKAFQPFKDKACALSNTNVSEELSMMIKKYVVDGQVLAVRNKEYQNVIENNLGIRCLYNTAVKELMWGLSIQMPCFLPGQYSELTDEDRLPMSLGMRSLLNNHKFDVNLDMMVTKRIIEMAGIIYECDRCVDKYELPLTLAAEHLWEISQIDTNGWDLLKLATALKIICYPKEKISDAQWLFPKELLMRLIKDSPRYKNIIFKTPCLELYNEIFSARNERHCAAKVLRRLVRQAKRAHEDEQAGKAASPRRKKICRGFSRDLINELSEWSATLSAKRERRDTTTLAPVDKLKSYTQFCSHPLNMTNRPGILCMDKHPSKDIFATGGIATNAVLFDVPSRQILCTLTGHSKEITSLKFVNRDGLFITGSADNTVRIWQGREDENYSCMYTLKDHTAEVEAVTVHGSQKYFVTTSRDNTWRFYDISTGSCLTQVGEPSGGCGYTSAYFDPSGYKRGYTCAAFDPSGDILATGSTDGAIKFWDLTSQSIITEYFGHPSQVNAISFSETGYLLATASLDGVYIFDIRKLSFMVKSCLHRPANVVEFHPSGSYLAIGGSDASVLKVDGPDYPDIKENPSIMKLTEPSETDIVTSMKFNDDARYIAVGSMEQNLRIFAV